MGGRRSLMVAPAVCAAVILMSMWAAGCGGVSVKTGELRTETQTVSLGAAQNVTVEVKQGAGQIAVSGGAADLMDATFTYNVDAWKPEVSYSVGGDRGLLSVKQPSQLNVAFGNQRYEWDLRLKDGVPLDLSVTLGAGTSQLVLGSLTLSALKVEAGAGDVTVDLSGYHVASFDGSIKGGAGKLTVIVPKDVGVSVHPSTGVGKTNIVGLAQAGDEYRNDAFGKTPVTVRLTVEAAVGEVNLRVAE